MLFFRGQKMAFRAPKSKKGLQKPRKTTPQMVHQTFSSCVQHFRASIKPIFENHVFRGVLELFYPLKRPKTRNSKENAPKIFFFAEMGCIYTGPNYIKRQSDSDNFLTFWYTLLCTFKQKFARTLCTFKQKLVHTMYV